MKESKDKPLKVIAGAPDRPLVIGNVEIPCYVLEDETRVLSQRGLQSGIGMSEGGGQGGARKIAGFMRWIEHKGIDTNKLEARVNSPIIFRPPRGSIAFGYPATLLVDICTAILSARDAEILQKST